MLSHTFQEEIVTHPLTPEERIELALEEFLHQARVIDALTGETGKRAQLAWQVELMCKETRMLRKVRGGQST
jgi:hypothetical protein